MSDTQAHHRRLKQDLIVAGGVGMVSAISIGGVGAVMGRVGDAEAQRLLEAIIPTSRLFCSAMMTVSATILALMLTMIGLGKQADTELADSHYERIVKIALYDAILFAAAVVMFVMHCVPVYESDSLPEWWYPSIYYGVLIASSVLAGGAISIVVLLYLAVKDVIQVVALGNSEHRHAVGNNAGTPSDQSNP